MLYIRLVRPFLGLVLLVGSTAAIAAAPAKKADQKQTTPPAAQGVTNPWVAPAPGTCNYSAPGLKHCTVEQNSIVEVFLSEKGPAVVIFDQPATEIVPPNPPIVAISSCVDRGNKAIPGCITKRVYYHIEKAFGDGISSNISIGKITITVRFRYGSGSRDDQVVIHFSDRLTQELRCAEREAATLQTVEDAKAQVFEEAKKLAHDEVMKLANQQRLEVHDLSDRAPHSGDRITLAALSRVQWGDLQRFVTFSVTNHPFGRMSRPQLSIDVVSAWLIRSGKSTSLAIKRTCARRVIPAEGTTLCTVSFPLASPPAPSDRLRIELKDTHIRRTVTLDQIPL